MKRLCVAALAVLGAVPANAWGPAAHEVVTAQAIETLPKPLRNFYKDHRLEMPTLALEPTQAEDTADRRFPLDRWLAFPFADLPHSEAAIKSKYGETAVGPARLPFLVQEGYAKLVDAFKTRDKARILAESDALALLVADLRNPLALTDNADGQKTGQHGLWVRFTVRFPEALDRKLKLEDRAAIFLDDPKEQVFAIMSGTYVWVDNVLWYDDLAKRGAQGYGEIYYGELERWAGPLLRDQLSLAASDIGSYWYTAWSAAGRPELQ